MPENRPTFGAYRLLSRLGTGGTAEVFLAATRGPDGRERAVALKRILPDFSDEPDFVSMLIDEARLVSLLAHPGIAAVVDLGREHGELYLAMEYVRGKDLSSVAKKLRARKARLEPELAAWVVAHMLDALDHAHHAVGTDGKPMELVHRDVSPANCLVSYEGEVKLIDFGIARATNRITRTQTGVLKGKYRYMSPEQATGRAMDGRSDIYSAGVVLHELLVGEKLHAGDSDLTLMKKIAAGRVPRLAENAGVDPHLAALVDRAVEKDPARRWQRASEFASALRGWLAAVAPHRDLHHDIVVFLQTLFAEDYAAEERLLAELSQERAPTRPPPPPPEAFAGGDGGKKLARTTGSQRKVAAADEEETEPGEDEEEEATALATAAELANVRSTSSSVRPVSSIVLPPPSRPPSRLPIIVAALVAGLVLFVVLRFGRAQPMSPPAAPVTTPVAVEPTPPPTPVVAPPAAPPKPAPEVRPTPRPAVAKAPRGLLTVQSIPGGRLWIDADETKHTTPVTALDVEAGPHVLWVVAPDGRRSEARCNVREGGVTEVSIHFE